jgi:predicted phage-related endonuclease
MPITTAQRERRQAHLGSSDLAALLGLDLRRNRYDLWLEKTGKLIPESQDEGNTPKFAGKLLEPAVLQWAELQIGKLTRNQYRSAKDRGLPIGCNIDAILNETGDPVEAKTSGLYGNTNDFYGEPNTDQVPDHVIVQSHGHMLTTEKEVCYVPVFVAFRGFVMYQVPRDAAITDAIGSEALNFWEKHVLADIPPENVIPHPAIVKRVRREANKIVPLDYALIEKWSLWKESESAAKKEKETALAEILAVIGDAEAGETEAGLFTFFETNRAGYEVKPTSFRTARFKKAK